MSFQPIVPFGGNLGWSFLQRTREDQQEAFDNSSTVARKTEYFRENIGKITSAEELVEDRRLLEVALGAFGLDEDINNKFYIKTVLEQGTLDDEAFANRLADKRYFALAEAFGFDLTPPKSVISTFPDDIIAKYKERQFEVAVGDQDQNMRLALGLERDLEAIAERETTEEVAWFTIMGNPALREVFEKALGLPTEIGTVDIDRQLEAFRDRSLSVFNVSNPAEFTDPDLQDKLIRNFLFRSELAQQSASSARGTVALSLLQAIPPLT